MYKPNEAKLFGAAIKQLLTERNLSQRQFAKQARLTTDYVSKLVNGVVAEPRQNNRRKIAKGLGITEQELLEHIAQYRDSEAEKTISDPPGLVESEEAIAKLHRESEQPDASSIEERYFRATSKFDSLEPLERKSRIQVLEEIASNKDFPRYHWKVMEFLADFVRRKAPRKEEEQGEEERSLKLGEDIQAALTVIGQPNVDPDKKILNLGNTNLAGLDLSQLNFEQVDFTGANLKGANLSRASLKGVNFTKANLEGVNLNGADLESANLYKTVLSKANLRGVRLEKAILIQTDLSFAYLERANLKGARLDKANLKKADLSGANLNESYLNNANIEGVNLTSVKSVSVAKRNQIKVTEVNMEGAVLCGAKLKGANFSKAKNLDLEQLRLADGDCTTVLPDYVEAPPHWM